MTTHVLKSWPAFFQAHLDGLKPWEVRINDRDYHVGDLLHLKEYEPSTGKYSGREAMCRVTFMVELGAVMVDMHHAVCMTIEPDQ